MTGSYRTDKQPSPKGHRRKTEGRPKKKTEKHFVAKRHQNIRIQTQGIKQTAHRQLPIANSHNKKNMKHNLLKSVILSVILLMGVSNAWADITFSGGYIYFDNSIGINQTYIQLCARQSSWTGVSTLSKINNTKLYYVANPQGSGWGGILGWVVIGNSSQKSNSNFDNWSSYGWCSSWNEYGFNDGSTYLIVPSSTSKSQSVTTSYYSGGYSALNSTQTIKTAVNGADANSKATITVTSYKLTGNGAISTQQSASISTSAKSTTISAARTATTTLTVGSVATGYKFDGWYTAATGGTQLSTSTTYTYYPTAATTVYARFSAKKYNITYKDQGDVAFSGTHASGYPTQHTYGTATTLKTATKTGYTFGGWFTNSGCTGTAITSLGATAYTAAITLYAKWTEKPKYTVTISSDGNGTVTPNTAQVGEIPVSITATPNDGYKFKNWTKTGNVTIADANNASTTITATGTGSSVTANFETAKRIYLKPAGDNEWANGNPRYAVYVIDDQSWHDMTKINNDIYYCDIKPTYQKVIFCRMNPGNSANDWGNRWTQTEDLTLPDNCNMFDIAKDASTENYDKASGTWMEYNAWHLAGAFNEWALCGQIFKEQGDGSFTFTQHLEADNTYAFKLVHNGEWYGNNGTMVRGTSTGWTMSTSEGDCKITADYTGDYTFTFNVSTKKLTVQYPILVKLVRSEFGHYGIKYNGQSYFSKDDDDVIVNVPYGATITFIEGQPYSDIYTGGIMQSAPTEVPQLDLDQPFIVLSDVTFDDNYVTKVDQVAYLGVPNSSTWDNSGNANLIWRHDSNEGFVMYDNVDKGELAFESNDVKYYKFNIIAGCNKFLFQRKNASTEADTHNTTGTFAETPAYIYRDLRSGINCYMLDGTVDGTKHNGYWCALPPQSGDYRLLYVEQVVEKDAQGTTITRKKAHPSDVVRANEITAEGAIVSLHTYQDRTYPAITVYDEGGNHTYDQGSFSNPEIILQKYDGSNWVDMESYMVYRQLETAHASMATLPGRKNASPGSSVDDFRIGDGIEAIKNDTHEDQGNGVWNFYIINNGTKVTVDLPRTHRYEGNYYIRTDAAFGGWNSYTGSDNHMTRSDVSKHHSNYSHYYCKWVEAVGTNVKFTIANDYGMAISDTLVADSTTLWGELLADADKMVTGETLPASANVRFAWNEKSNFLHRAYLAGSTDVASRFLVLEGKSNQLYNAEGNALAAGVNNGTDPRYGLKANEEIFNDISNWVYYTDVQMIPGAELKLTAKYNGKVQYFVGTEDAYCDTVLMGTGSQKYLIRLLYDFKTNELISAYVPGDNSTIEPIQTNLMLLRKENETPRQLSFTTNNMNEVGKRAYGVLELTKATLIDNTQGKNIYERSLYWISFPFNVRITDIFGFGEYGKHWIIQSYDGAKRAANGLWTDSETNWVYHFDPNTLNAGTTDQGIMKRGVGYVVALDLDQIKADDPFVGRINTLALYFPSTNTITDHIVNTSKVTIPVPEHVCTINRNTPKGDRRIKDSHWNVIGVPSYINAKGNFGSIEGKFDHIELENRPQELQFYYRWLGDYDKYEVTTPSATVNFNSLTAYMVQYAGDLTWTSVLNEGPASLAAKRNSDEMEQYHLCLELQQNGQEQDRTFIQLQEEEVTTSFDFNYDLCKIKNSGANIYSLIATDRDPIEVAGNVLPVGEAIIPLGIKLDAAGEYTFAMPDGTDGIVAELIDYEANTTTNLLFSDYTVSLPKGTNETRFALSVRPDKTVTSMENITTPSDSEVRKFIIDGVLYMQKDDVLYDAQGHIVR